MYFFFLNSKSQNYALKIEMLLLKLRSFDVFPYVRTMIRHCFCRCMSRHGATAVHAAQEGDLMSRVPSLIDWSWFEISSEHGATIACQTKCSVGLEGRRCKMRVSSLHLTVQIADSLFIVLTRGKCTARVVFFRIWNSILSASFYSSLMLSSRSLSSIPFFISSYFSTLNNLLGSYDNSLRMRFSELVFGTWPIL